MNRILAGLLAVSLGTAISCTAQEQAAYWVVGNHDLDVLSNEYMQAYKVKNTTVAREKCLKLLQICPTYIHAIYNLACAEAMLGHKDEAFAQLKKAAELRFGWDNVDHLKGDSDLVTLHDDKRWAEIVSKCEENKKLKTQFDKAMGEMQKAEVAKNYAVVVQKCDEIEKLDPETDLTHYRCEAFAALGKKDEAFVQMAKIVRDQPKTRTLLSDYYFKTPALANLFNDPRYQALVAQARATEKSWGVPEARRTRTR